LLRRLEQPRLRFEKHGEIAEGVLHELRVVADVLGWRIDLVRNAGGELPDRLHLLGVAQLHLHLAPLLLHLRSLGNVSRHDDEVFHLPAFVRRPARSRRDAAFDTP
jgi:hypothetical protein